jgi:hypothetical protein
MSSDVGLVGADFFMAGRPLRGTSIAALVGRTVKSKHSLDGLPGSWMATLADFDK